jgi:hypothetical protein
MEIGGFTLRERMHAGSMASLWRVERAGDPTPMVMKLPRVRDGDDPAAIVGFEVEQMILPRLSGPHVPRFVAAAGFDALHELHRQHVSHLDLKPSQVLWRPGGEAGLIDDGLSRHDRLPDLLAEEFRLPMGTGPYISPEQVRGVRDDPRGDLFVLGVMLYHLATGERPFGFPHTVRGLRKRLWRDPLPPRAHVPDLPPWLQEVILGCIEVDPARRWQTAAQVALLLRHPEQVPLGPRADRRGRDGLRARWTRWFRAIGHEAEGAAPVQRHLAAAPIVMVAVDLSDGIDPLAEALRETTRRVIRAEPSARLACVSVLEVARIANDAIVDASGRNLHVQGLAKLAHWSRARAARRSRHAPRARGARCGRRDRRVRDEEPGGSRADGRACELESAPLPRQRVVAGRGHYALHGDRGAGAGARRRGRRRARRGRRDGRRGAVRFASVRCP